MNLVELLKLLNYKQQIDLLIFFYANKYFFFIKQKLKEIKCIITRKCVRTYTIKLKFVDTSYI